MFIEWRETPETGKNFLCEIFCIDHTNYCWHARHIGSGPGCGQQPESANQQALFSDLTNEKAQCHIITPTGPRAIIKVIFKLRVNLGLDLITAQRTCFQ